MPWAQTKRMPAPNVKKSMSQPQHLLCCTVCLPAKHDVCFDYFNLKMQLQTGFLDKEQFLKVIYVLELLQLPKTTMTKEFVFVSELANLPPLSDSTQMRSQSIWSLRHCRIRSHSLPACPPPSTNSPHSLSAPSILAALERKCTELVDSMSMFSQVEPAVKVQQL